VQRIPRPELDEAFEPIVCASADRPEDLPDLPCDPRL
jgi:hypothetical protein